MVRLAFEVNSGCGRCHETGGCGSSLAQPVCGKPKTLLVPDHLGLQIDDRVLVEVPDAMLSRGATRAYLIPLMLLFVVACLVAHCFPCLHRPPGKSQRILVLSPVLVWDLIAAWWQLQRSQHSDVIPVPHIVHRIS